MLFIADIGSNAATLEQACQSIYAAKKAGADIVKFQLFSHYDLYGEGSKERKIESWLPKLAEVCEDLGVEFGCTAFSVNGLAIVDPFVKRHKIASSCITHEPLLDSVALTGKNVFLSAGAATIEEIYAALNRLNMQKVHVDVLYCPAAYPSRWCDYRMIVELKNALPWYVGVGFSDHTTDVINAPLLAHKKGATVIEKHFTAFPELQTPDRGHSLTQSEFKAMVLATRRQPIFGPSPEEAEFREFHQVRFVDGKGWVRRKKPC